MVKRYELPPSDERTQLREGVIRALKAVPKHFKSTINIEGLSAIDLFSVNEIVGGAIESQTVETLNETRYIWDPDGKWTDYSFKRYAQSFPDVRFEIDNKTTPLIGIELKGWYLLAKEAMPSFRFRASAKAMTVWDLIAVFPWSLSNGISGTPILESPFIEQAKYAADLRTHYWEHRKPNAKRVEFPDTHPYPEAGSKYSDIVQDDSGNNFGRIARIPELMDDWIKDSLKTNVAGIEARWWVQFIKMFDERQSEEKIQQSFKTLAKKLKKNDEWTEEVIQHVMRLMEM